MNFGNVWFEPTDRALPWQRLEAVLSVHIDMIESEKVGCIRDDVEQSGDIKRVDFDGDIKWLETRDRPDTMLADPVIGVKRNREVMVGPWIVQPYTKEVLEECLRTRKLLVQATEEKMSTAPRVDTKPEYGLANEEMLESASVTEEFSKQLLLRSRRSRFTFIAPGFRLLSHEEFNSQPLKGMMTMHDDLWTMEEIPALLFRGGDTCKASENFPHP